MAAGVNFKGIVIRHRRLILTIALGVLALCWYVARVPDPFYRDPQPVRTLKRHREEIMRYLASIEQGRVRERNDGRGYFLLDTLADCDVSVVEKEGNCIVIAFAFMPTDAVPQLIYSPSGVSALPERYVQPGKYRITYFELKQLDDHWFYCLWDN